MKTVAALCLLMMTRMSVAQTSASTTFKSVRAAHDVALETDPQSVFWQGAVPVKLTVDDWGKSVPAPRTEVRSRWTEDNLYFLFTCPYQVLHLKPDPHPATETNQLWNWDVAEVFIGSDFENIRRYKEFEMSPQAEWVDLDINLDSPRHEDGWVWNSGFKVAARIDREKKIWYGAMRIPLAAIDPNPPHAGSRFRMNLYRTEGAAPHTKAFVWQPTMNASFHVPERFGTLELVDQP